MSKILVIEDEQVIRELLCDNLEFDGFTSVAAASLFAAEEGLVREQPDMLLLDLNLPDGNGAEWLKKKRDAGMSLPVIICTIRDREIDIIKALDAGADDYVTKPFRIRELIARIRAVLRRAGNDSEAPALPQIGRLSIDFAARTASCNDRQTSLTTTEWQMLELLWKNKNQVLSREQIIDHIWGINDLEDSRAVDVHIGRLRKKIEAGNEPETLLTVRGFGYKLKI
ncbi:MAG: DNA-binding response regulator [Candidatus Riflebacteria bacterium HGW-Riflebacteria-2]|jgi:two-component system response regulator MprA|nr:MAG: DNA-binding response regulator [Candidatus Riflebacteria bacterium HGW-Riflebacteria-2]